MIGVCRIDNRIYPYLIVLRFNYKPKAAERSFGDTPYVYQNVKLKNWIDNLNAYAQTLDMPLSSYFKSRDLGKKYPAFKRIEPMLEFILSKLYKDTSKDNGQSSKSKHITKQRSISDRSTSQSILETMTEKDFTFESISPKKLISIAKNAPVGVTTQQAKKSAIHSSEPEAKHNSVSPPTVVKNTKVLNKPKAAKRFFVDDIFSNYHYKSKKPRKENTQEESPQQQQKPSRASADIDKIDIPNKLESTILKQSNNENSTVTTPNITYTNNYTLTGPKNIPRISVEEYQRTVKARFETMLTIPDIECIIPSSHPYTRTAAGDSYTMSSVEPNDDANVADKETSSLLHEVEEEEHEYIDYDIEYEDEIVGNDSFSKRKYFSKVRRLNLLKLYCIFQE
ncbi:MAG: hypothetical protein EXX96DRAFT_565586 [Benjaminiella poitrasii]|nr:MAG: hypothetical protein EXX96DRAFT_565586 [Benjaminiella poitrasii]